MKIKMIILNYLVKHLFKGLTEDEIFKVVGKKLYIGEEEATEETARMYKQKAQEIYNSIVWKDIVKKIQYESNKLMFEKSKTTEDLFFGKGMLYNLELVNGYLKRLADIKS